MLKNPNDLYEWMVALLLRDAPGLDDETLLRRIEEIAELAFASGPTLLSDPRLDRLLLDVAGRLDPKPGGPGPLLDRQPKKVLHVATDIHHVGGHTRILLNWIQADHETAHTVAVTSQRGHITAWMREALAAAGCELHLLFPSEARLERARRLRELVMRGGYDLVISHHYHSDTVLACALGVAGLPQMFVFNQGDHVFWLGVSMTDAVLDFRKAGMDVTRRIRGAPRSLYLPYILEPRAAAPSRAEARRLAGLEQWRVVMVSMARIQKFLPCNDYNLHRTLQPVMQRHPDVLLLLIGVNESEYVAMFGVPPPPNVRPLGNVDQPADLLRAADIWIEPMPWGTALATFDTCRYGAVPMWVYGLAPCIYGCTVRDLFEGSGCEMPTVSELDYQNRLEQLIDDQPYREKLGARIKQYCNGRFLAPEWLGLLRQALSAAQGGRHELAPKRPLVFDHSPAFVNYMHCLSEDMAVPIATCMNHLRSVGRWQDLLRLLASFCWHRLRRPRPQGLRVALRFTWASLARLTRQQSPRQPQP